jgi:hypothetical protein
MLFGDSPSPGLISVQAEGLLYAQKKGIARLAAQSEVLEAKRVVRYFELEGD